MLAAPHEAPLWDGRVEDPAEGWTFADHLAAYRDVQAALGTSRTVVVQSIIYGADNSLLTRTIDALGPERTRGIGLVTDAATEADLNGLVAAGIVGIRLNYVHGGVLTWDGVEALAPRLAARGLHVQMLLRADRHLTELADRIAALPVPVVLDHIAWPDLAAGPEEPGFRRLMDLVAAGDVHVKLSALYRHCPAPFDAADDHVRALLTANPGACLWGTDWPHIMLAGTSPGPVGAMLDAFDRVCPDDATRQAVLVHNPARLYGFD